MTWRSKDRPKRRGYRRDTFAPFKGDHGSRDSLFFFTSFLGLLSFDLPEFWCFDWELDVSLETKRVRQEDSGWLDVEGIGGGGFGGGF